VGGKLSETTNASGSSLGHPPPIKKCSASLEGGGGKMREKYGQEMLRRGEPAGGVEKCRRKGPKKGNENRGREPHLPLVRGGKRILDGKLMLRNRRGERPGIDGGSVQALSKGKGSVLEEGIKDLRRKSSYGRLKAQATGENGEYRSLLREGGGATRCSWNAESGGIVPEGGGTRIWKRRWR